MSFELTIKHYITDSAITDIVSTAFEGGINYWCREVRVVDAKGREYEYASDVPVFGSVNLYVPDYHDDYQKCWKTLDPKAIKRGLALLGDYPWVAKNILEEDADANDADVFVQLCVFGRVVYG